MAVKIDVTKKLDNNFVQVEVNSPKVSTRYFKVPEAKADEFCKEYKDFDKKIRLGSMLRTFVPTLLLCGIVGKFTKTKSKLVQWAGAIAAGLAAVTGATYLNTNIFIKKEDALLKKHSAEEFSKESKQLPFLNKSK